MDPRLPRILEALRGLEFDQGDDSARFASRCKCFRLVKKTVEVAYPLGYALNDQLEEAISAAMDFLYFDGIDAARDILVVALEKCGDAEPAVEAPAPLESITVIVAPGGDEQTPDRLPRDEILKRLEHIEVKVLARAS